MGQSPVAVFGRRIRRAGCRLRRLFGGPRLLVPESARTGRSIQSRWHRREWFLDSICSFLGRRSSIIVSVFKMTCTYTKKYERESKKRTSPLPCKTGNCSEEYQNTPSFLCPVYRCTY